MRKKLTKLETRYKLVEKALARHVMIDNLFNDHHPEERLPLGGSKMQIATRARLDRLTERLERGLKTP